MPASSRGPVASPDASAPAGPDAGTPDDKGRRQALTVLVSVWILMVGFVAVQTILPDGPETTTVADIEVEECAGPGCEVRSVDDGFLFRATCAESVDKDPARLQWALDGETVAAADYDPAVHPRDPQGRVLAEHVYVVPEDGRAHELVLTCIYPDGSSDDAAASVAVRTTA